MTHGLLPCRRCGTLASPAARFCSHCGARLGNGGRPGAARRSPASLFLTFLLAIGAVMLGGLGACFVVAGLGALSSGPNSIVWSMLCFLLAVAAFIGVVRMFRS